MDYLQYLLDQGERLEKTIGVLNLIINGLPSILIIAEKRKVSMDVLNLIINGLPSIL